MELLVMSSGVGVSMKDALGAERERARCRRLSETSDVVLANVFRRRDGRRHGPVRTGGVCQQGGPDNPERLSERVSTRGTVLRMTKA